MWPYIKNISFSPKTNQIWKSRKLGKLVMTHPDRCTYIFPGLIGLIPPMALRIRWSQPFYSGHHELRGGAFQSMGQNRRGAPGSINIRVWNSVKFVKRLKTCSIQILGTFGYLFSFSIYLFTYTCWIRTSVNLFWSHVNTGISGSCCCCPGGSCSRDRRKSSRPQFFNHSTTPSSHLYKLRRPALSYSRMESAWCPSGSATPSACPATFGHCSTQFHSPAQRSNDQGGKNLFFGCT